MVFYGCQNPLNGVWTGYKPLDRVSSSCNRFQDNDLTIVLPYYILGDINIAIGTNTIDEYCQAILNYVVPLWYGNGLFCRHGSNGVPIIGEKIRISVRSEILQLIYDEKTLDYFKTYENFIATVIYCNVANWRGKTIEIMKGIKLDNLSVKPGKYTLLSDYIDY